MTLPPILYGTAWKKDRTASLVEKALEVGFRGIDTACQPKHYDEAGVGAGVARAMQAGLRREALYLQTKFTPLDGQDPRRVPYDASAPLEDQVRQSCKVSLENLGTNYLDGLVLHSPMRTLEQTLRVFRVFQELVEEGLVKSVGISNCYELPTLEAVWNAARVKPTVLQNRFYADTGYDAELRAFCGERQIRYQSFWTLTANPHVLGSRTLRELARRHSATVEQVFLRSLSQCGIVPLVGTTSETHMREDLAMFDLELTAADVESVLALL